MNARSLLLIVVAAVAVACSKGSPLPDDGFVNVPGGRVAFRVIGGGTSIPVLWIHGGPGGSSCSYIENLTGLAATRPVVFYDQLGSGYSDRIEDLERFAHLSRFVEEIDAVRAELGLHELHLVGHSWGSAVLLEYLLTAEPTGIKSTVFVSPFISNARWVEDANELLKELPAEAQEVIRAAVEPGDFETDEFERAYELYRRRYGLRTPREQVNLAPCRKQPSGNSGLEQFLFGPSEFVAGDGPMKDYDRIGRLSELDSPVLFIAGQYDRARPETMEIYQAMVDGSRLEILPDAGHAVQLDEPELLNSTLVDFFSAVEK